MERQGTGDGPREEGWVSSGSVFETSTVLVFKEKKRIIDPEAQEWRQLTAQEENEGRFLGPMLGLRHPC